MEVLMDILGREKEYRYEVIEHNLDESFIPACERRIRLISYRSGMDITWTEEDRE